MAAASASSKIPWRQPARAPGQVCTLLIYIYIYIMLLSLLSLI